MHNFKKYISVFFCIGVLFVIGCSEDNPVEPTETHNEAEGLILRTDGQDLVIVKEGTVKSGQITVNVDSQTPTIKAVFLDEDDDEFEPHEEGSSLALSLEVMKQQKLLWWTVNSGSLLLTVKRSEQQPW